MMSKWFSMSGRRALITGASLSIGRSIALGFAEHGAAIAVHYSAAADKVRIPLKMTADSDRR
jgi:NAD(P)-dependent dehydrogenase (short-subunit alcohol dehydrogenase family)